jgi:hypothetical protein
MDYPAKNQGKASYGRVFTWVTLGTAFFYFRFAAFGSKSLMERPPTHLDGYTGPISGAHDAELGIVGGSTVAPEQKKPVIYVYEKNQKTGSTSWVQMFKQAKGKLSIADCRESDSKNAMRIGWETFEADTLVPCHVRRMSIPRATEVRVIASFNLEKDMVMSAYMQWKNLTVEQVDKNGDDWLEYKKTFKILWSLDYMGYADSHVRGFREETCPMSDHVKSLVETAVHDTYLPVSHDLPCISYKLVKDMLGLEILNEVQTNIRSGIGHAEWELDLSCVDIALSRGFTSKLLSLYDGTDLSKSDDWRGVARRKERDCHGKAPESAPL